MLEIKVLRHRQIKQETEKGEGKGRGCTYTEDLLDVVDDLAGLLLACSLLSKVTVPDRT